MPTYREGLPPLPFRMRGLKLDPRGYPIPWFVARLPDGSYDLRVADMSKRLLAYQDRRCWVCGSPLMASLTFVLGPMCTITRTTSEPGCHKECAEYSALACPFLTQQEKRRNPVGLPAQLAPDAGIPILRQPGVTALWQARTCSRFADGRGGWLVKVGEPQQVWWYCQGREATRAEVLASIDSGYPTLVELAEQEGPEALAELEQHRSRALQYLPEEVAHAHGQS